MRRGVHWMLRQARALLLGLLLVALVLVAGACAYLSTTHGRARLLQALVAEVDRLLPGSIEAGELSRLTPTRVELHDLGLRAPGGNEVVRLREVRARLAPWALLEGRILVEELVVEGAAVDLRAIDDPHLGLLSAVVPPDDLADPNTEGGSAPQIVFDAVRIADCQTRVPVAFDGAPDELWLAAVQGRLAIGAGLDIDVQHVQARVRREHVELGGARASGRLASFGRSHVELKGTLLGAELDASLELGTHERALPGWPHSPFELELAVRELDAGSLATLTRSAPLPVQGVFAAQLALRGTPAAFEAQGALTTPGGVLALRGSGQESSRIEVSAQTQRLALRALAPSWPARTVAGALDAKLSLVGDRVRLSASGRARVDGVALPEVSLRAEQMAAASWQVELALHDRWLDLNARATLPSSGALAAHASGWLEPAPGLALAKTLGLAPAGLAPFRPGHESDAERVELRVDLARSAAGALEANGVLRAPRSSLAAGRLERLKATFSLAGRLPRPKLHLSADWHAALPGAERLVPGHLALDGGPSRYRFELQGGAPGALRASGWLEREARGERFALTASGRLGAAPWRFAMQPSLWLDSGEVVLPGVELELDAQTARARGRYAGAASELVVELDDVDVQRALAPLLPGTRLSGELDGRVEARGSPQRPALSFGVRASRFGLTGAPTVDASLAGSLDMGAGSARLTVDLRESAASAPPRIDLRLDGEGRFDPGRSWPGLLSTREQRLALEVRRLDSTLLAELADASAPGAFDVRGRAELRVSAGVPTLESLLAGRLAWTTPGSATEPPRERSARVEHSVTHAGRELRTELVLDDEGGRWLELSGDAKLPASAPATWVELSSAPASEMRRWLSALSWQVRLDAAPRPLSALPAWLGRPEVGGAELGLQLAARREPGQAPVGTLAIELASIEREQSPRRCASRPLTTQAQVELASGELRAAVEAFAGQTRLLRAATVTELDLQRWLGGEAPSWAKLEVDVDAQRLVLDGLPFLCGKLRGELTGHGTIRDPLGSPVLDADVSVMQFSLGSEQTLDVDARVSIDARHIDVSGALAAEGRRSPLSIRWSRGAEGSASVGSNAATRQASFQLEQLPLAPLLPLEGPISHVSGHVSGTLQSSAEGDGRELSGALRFDQVALTLTELAQPLSDIGGELVFADGAVIVKDLTGHDGDGELTLNGRIEPHGGRSFDSDLTLVSRKFPLRQAGEVVAQTTATARLQAKWRPELRRLRVSLKDFDTWLERHDGSRGLSLEPHPDVTLKARRNGLEATSGGASAPRRAPIPMVVEIDAPEQFWIKRADFALKLSASLQIAAGVAKTEHEQGDVSVTGELRFERGYMEMLGKSFEVKRGGTLRFTGGTSAVLDLSAEYEDRRTDKMVVVRLQGSADAPALEFQVDGRKVSAGEAFQAIYGSNTTSDDVDPEAQADQIIGALMAGVLTTSMRRRLGAMAPILSVDAADEDRGEQLRAGFELDALIPDFLRDIVTGVYVEGSFSSDKQADQAGSKDVQTGVLIELHFPYNIVSSVRYGPDTTWSLDLGWQP